MAASLGEDESALGEEGMGECRLKLVVRLRLGAADVQTTTRSEPLDCNTKRSVELTFCCDESTMLLCSKVRL